MFGSCKPLKDERIVAEINRVYRAAYYIMDFGIAVDLYFKMSGTAAIPSGLAGFRAFWLELIVFLTANLVTLFQLWRRGLMDDNAIYAEADTFPLRHYLLESVAAGAGTSLLLCVLRVLFARGTALGPVVLAFTFGSMFVFTSTACLLVEYLMFRAARRRRRALYGEEDER